MRSLWPIVIGTVIALSNCSAARTQGCATTLQPHFATYHSAYISGSTIYTSVSIQGYASVFPGPGCNMSVATHKVGAYNKISSTGGWNYSASGCPTCYFSTSNSQQFVGVPGAVYLWDWQGEAFCSIVGGFSGGGGTSSIPVVTASISQRTSQTTSNDDSAATNYHNTVGTSNLGPIIANGSEVGCLIGNETVASLTPSTYSGTVNFSRIVLMEYDYVNQTPDGTPILNQLDDPSDSNMDVNPQSGGSGGKVYAVDAPGTSPYYVDTNTYRTRMNFAINAQLPNGIRISPYYYSYVRVSCRRTATGLTFINDVAGDNTINQGTTATSWNLQ